MAGPQPALGSPSARGRRHPRQQHGPYSRKGSGSGVRIARLPAGSDRAGFVRLGENNVILSTAPLERRDRSTRSKPTADTGRFPTCLDSAACPSSRPGSSWSSICASKTIEGQRRQSLGHGSRGYEVPTGESRRLERHAQRTVSRDPSWPRCRGPPTPAEDVEPRRYNRISRAPRRFDWLTAGRLRAISSRRRNGCPRRRRIRSFLSCTTLVVVPAFLNRCNRLGLVGFHLTPN